MKRRRPRIAVLANTLESAAGVEAGGHVHFIEIVRRWTWADIVIFAPEIGREAFVRRLPGATFVAMPSWDSLLKSKALLFLSRAFFGLSRFGALRNCDAIVATSHGLPDVLPAALAGDRALLIVHHVIQGAGRRDGSFARNSLAFAAERASLALAARTFRAVVCSSRLVASELEHLGFRQHIAITTSGVDHVPKPPSPTPDRTGAVFVGRIHPTKGVDDLVRAWRFVVDTLPNETLTLVGASDDAAFAIKLDALIEELGLGANIRKRGRLSDDEKNAALYAAKAFAFASKEEGWGIALGEAMRAGLPCATYALPVFDEVFPGGRLAAPIGDVAAFGKNLVRLLSDDALSERLSLEASALADALSWQRASDIEALAVQQLLAARS